MVKRILTLILTVMLIASLTACGSSGKTADKADSKGSSSSGQEAGEQDTDGNKESQTDAAGDSEESESDESGAQTGSGSDVLVIYFSANNMNDTDAVSSATQITDGKSAVQCVAEAIHEEVGGDIVPIIPKKDYPTDYDGVLDAAKAETDNDERPAYQKLPVDPTSYKTVFIGYPMWWYTIPMVLETFFDDYDFSGVTIVPFNTHEGSSDGGTYDMIREREPKANVLEGLPIRGGDAGTGDTKQAVKDWLAGLDL